MIWNRNIDYARVYQLVTPRLSNWWQFAVTAFNCSHEDIKNPPISSVSPPLLSDSCWLISVTYPARGPDVTGSFTSSVREESRQRRSRARSPSPGGRRAFITGGRRLWLALWMADESGAPPPNTGAPTTHWWAAVHCSPKCAVQRRASQHRKWLSAMAW